MITLQHNGIPALDYTSNIDSLEYAIDSETSNYDCCDIETESVDVDTITIQPDLEENLGQLINPLQESSNYGIDLYLQLLQYMQMNSS